MYARQYFIIQHLEAEFYYNIIDYISYAVLYIPSITSAPIMWDGAQPTCFSPAINHSSGEGEKSKSLPNSSPAEGQCGWADMGMWRGGNVFSQISNFFL